MQKPKKLRNLSNQKHKDPENLTLRLHYGESLKPYRIHYGKRRNSKSEITSMQLKNP
jgi:hypothetical protein